MKKILVVALVAMLGISTYAQDGLKGTWFATAQLGYSDNGGSGSDAYKVTSVVPIVGTFVTPNVALGIGAGFVSVDDGGTTSSTTVVEPLARKYWNVAGSLYFYGQVAVPLLFGENTTTYGATLTPGLDYVVNKWFTVEFSTTLASLHFTSVDGGDTSTAFSLNPMAHSSLGTTAQVGFKFLF